MTGGRGTRLGLSSLDNPKALYVVGGETLIDRIIDQYLVASVSPIVIEIRPGEEAIRNHLQSRWPLVDFIYVSADPDLGSASSVVAIIEHAPRLDIVVTPVDTVSPRRIVHDMVALATKRGCAGVLLATPPTNGNHHVWMEIDGDVAVSLGKRNPPQPLSFGGTRWFSADAAEQYLRIASDRPDQDSERLGALVAASPGDFIVLTHQHVFDIDTLEDRMAAEAVHGMES